MNEIAFFMEKTSISYTSIFITLAVIAAVACSCLIAASERKNVLSVFACSVLSAVTGTLLSRVVYWYCMPGQFDGILSALTDFSRGGYSLVGVIIGVVLAVLIVRLVRMTDSVLSLMDTIAPGAALGIGIGRLSGFFSADDKGNVVFTEPEMQRLPFAYPVTDETTGSVTWRFASFLWESAAAFLIFAVLMVLIFLRISGIKRMRRGSAAMTFLSMFGATQATLESTRYDALHMRSNGFISLMQLVALIMLLIPAVYYGIKLLVHNRNTKVPYVMWGTLLVAIGGAGFLEYKIQRSLYHALGMYPFQVIALTVVSLATMYMAISIDYSSAEPKKPENIGETKRSAPEPKETVREEKKFRKRYEQPEKIRR